MPITSSAKKALRQSKRRKAQNLIKKTAYKDALKNVRTFVAQKKNDEAAKVLSALFAALDKAAKTRVIERNKADRLKSRAAQLIARSSKASS